MDFAKLGLSKQLLHGLEREHFSKPFPVQEQSIPAILKGKDLLGIAPTGSGKTASYALPILNGFKRQAFQKSRSAKVLVLVPTRELAVQVNKVFHQFANYLPANPRCLAVYGGVAINPQMKALFGVDVLTATPGRLLELIQSNAIKMNEVKTLVLDEADKMLNMGFKKELESILQLLPEKRQNLLFSATLSEDLTGLHQVILNDPFVVRVETEPLDISKIEQKAYQAPEEKKGPLLRHLIKENSGRTLVFTSSTFNADKVADKLRKNGISARAVHSKKTQGSRSQALEELKNGTLSVVVATDLLSRGIDIPNLEQVINYELPRSPKDFIHRIGRTGRAENYGRAITLVSPDEEHHFEVIQKKMKQWVDFVEFDLTQL